MTSLYIAIMNFLNRDEEGQGLAEYALILALIAIIAIVALIFLGSRSASLSTSARRSRFSRQRNKPPTMRSAVLSFPTWCVITTPIGLLTQLRCALRLNACSFHERR